MELLLKEMANTVIAHVAVNACSATYLWVLEVVVTGCTLHGFVVVVGE